MTTKHNISTEEDGIDGHLSVARCESPHYKSVSAQIFHVSGHTHVPLSTSVIPMLVVRVSPVLAALKRSNCDFGGGGGDRLAESGAL